jgi:NADH:ubiquinone oxidoreductase subunit F (NADH-binding)
VAVKMRTVARHRGGVVVANGAEGEPASRKDHLLLDQHAHLVLDGAQLAAEAVRARRIVLYVTEKGAGAAKRAVDQRPGDRLEVELVVAPDRFVSGESSAAVQAVSGGPALPAFTVVPSAERGVGGRPTLVLNVETLANVALIDRYGATWFRSMGTESDPGTALVTVCGDVQRPGVYEIAHGTALCELLDGAGTAQSRAVLLGGYHGTWLRAERAADLRLAPAILRSVGAVLGPGIVAVLDANRCPLREAAPVVHYLAQESAGQCGPCLNGLPALAEVFGDVADGGRVRPALARLHRWTAMVVGRGACHHPDGVGRFIESLLAEFPDEVRLHEHGRCSAASGLRPALPLPLDAA